MAAADRSRRRKKASASAAARKRSRKRVARSRKGGERSLRLADRIVELRRVPASKLRAHPENWRRHSKAQRGALLGVLEQIGWVGAALAYEDADGLVLIDGHLHGDLGGEVGAADYEVPTLVTDLDADEARLVLATLDPLAAMAQRDDAQLRALLDEVRGDSDRVEGLLDQLRQDLGGEVEERTPADDVPELPKRATTRPGDLWQLGDHRLVCGDATEASTIARLLNAARPTLLATDPPYGIEYDPAWREKAHREGHIQFGARRRSKVEGDARVDWSAAYKLLDSATIAYVWHAALLGPEIRASLEAVDFEARIVVTWVKDAFTIGRSWYHWQHEPCLVAVRKGSKPRWLGGRSQSTVWRATHRTSRVEGGDTDHPTQKPVELWERPIRNHLHRGEALIDPFAGSGTAIIAAERQRRVAYAVELSPHWCDVIVERWQAYTGEKASREGGPRGRPRPRRTAA